MYGVLLGLPYMPGVHTTLLKIPSAHLFYVRVDWIK